MTTSDQSNIINRKGEHIALSLDPRSQGVSEFEKIKLDYCALPEINLIDVDTSYNLFGHKLSMPLIIASMTGGSEKGELINTNLALAAESCNIALAVGSQRLALDNIDAKSTFAVVRKNAPNAYVIANMGAIQLNHGKKLDDFRRVIDMIEANALYLHINPLQEALQPGGDTDYAGLTTKIAKLIERIQIPVFIKEVGHGVSSKTASSIFDCGAAALDVAGAGGTSYAWIESKRSKNTNFENWFKDLGISTVSSVEQAFEARTNPSQLIIASGGVRSPIDGLKARTIGADMFSAAVPFLAAALQSPEATIKELEDWRMGLQIAMFSTSKSVW